MIPDLGKPECREALENVLARRADERDSVAMQAMANVLQRRRQSPGIVVDNSEVAYAVNGLAILVDELQGGLARYAAGVEELAKDEGALAAAIDRQTQMLARFLSDLKAILKPRERQVIKDAKGEIIGWKEV